MESGLVFLRRDRGGKESSGAVSMALGLAVPIAVPDDRSATITPEQTVNSGPHDFDFLIGHWTVAHRRLKDRLAHSIDWETFSGSCDAWAILGGHGNVDNNVLELAAGTYRAATLRMFDSRDGTWSIWWFDLRRPQQTDPPVVGTFRDGIGAFYADDVWNGSPIRVRFVWSRITARSARWEQAFSDDAGKTWETNWVMEFAKTDRT